MQINSPSQGEDDWSTLLGRRPRPLSYRVVEWPFCYSSLLGHGNRLKYSYPQPHQAKQRPKCTNSPPPWRCKGKKIYIIPHSLEKGRESKPPQSPTHALCFPGSGVGGFQWQVHYIYLVSKSEKELFFRESITSQMYRISRSSYETLSADIRYTGGWNFKTKWFPDIWVNITDDELSREWHLVEW